MSQPGARSGPAVNLLKSCSRALLGPEDASVGGEILLNSGHRNRISRRSIGTQDDLWPHPSSVGHLAPLLGGAERAAGTPVPDPSDPHPAAPESRRAERYSCRCWGSPAHTLSVHGPPFDKCAKYDDGTRLGVTAWSRRTVRPSSTAAPFSRVVRFARAWRGALSSLVLRRYVLRPAHDLDTLVDGTPPEVGGNHGGAGMQPDIMAEERGQPEQRVQVPCLDQPQHGQHG